LISTRLVGFHAKTIAPQLTIRSYEFHLGTPPRVQDLQKLSRFDGKVLAPSSMDQCGSTISDFAQLDVNTSDFHDGICTIDFDLTWEIVLEGQAFTKK
jgi:hypothetical protein